MVYSTNPDYNFDYVDENSEETLAPGSQDLLVMLDRKQRKGKSVTLVCGFVGEEDDLKRQDMMVRDCNFVKYDKINGEMDALTKIRSHDPGAMSTISGDEKRVKVEFRSKVKAIAPGQSAVFYEGDDLIGGGIIE